MSNEACSTARSRAGLSDLRRARAVGAACVALALLGACDEREQKPKVASLSPIGAAHAQQTDLVVPPAAMTGAIAPVDETFALFAASSGMAQIEGARLVLKTTRDEGVREYAQRIVRDHTQSAEQLRRIVAPRGLKLPPAPTGRHADMMTKLSGVAPAELDGAFLQRFGLDAHKEAIALFERHAKEGKDPQLTRYARDTLATLREHMSAAHKLVHAAGATR